MRSKRIITLVGVGMLLLLSFQTATYALTLEEAVAGRTVDATVIGSYVHPGAIQGKSLLVTMRRLGPQDVSVTIRIGTRFVPEDRRRQTMTCAEEARIDLRTDEAQEFEINAMCVEKTRMPPMPGLEYQASGMVPDNLVRVLKVISARNLYQDEAARLAVWAVTDSLTSVQAGLSEERARRVQELLNAARSGTRFIPGAVIPTAINWLVLVLILLGVLLVALVVIMVVIATRKPAPPPPPPARRCPVCGNILQPLWTMCPYCPTPEPKPEPARPIVSQDATGRKTIVIGGQQYPLLAQLVVREGPQQGTTFMLYPADRFIIGRDARYAHYVVNDDAVSHEQAAITYRDGKFFISDMASRNGTFVNGRLLTSAVSLYDKDTIRVGGTTLVYVNLWQPW